MILTCFLCQCKLLVNQFHNFVLNLVLVLLIHISSNKHSPSPFLHQIVAKMVKNHSKWQWHNSRGQSTPWHFSLGNFCWPTRKREVRKKGKMEKKRRKIKKGRWKIENGRRKGYKIFFFSIFSFFKTTEICFGFYQNIVGILYQEKAFHTGKKSGKMTLPPLKNIPLMPLANE